MAQRLTPPTPLDLSNGEIGASDEENEVPSSQQSDKKNTASPILVLVKCEASELNQSQPGVDEEDDDEEDETVHPDQYPFSMLTDSDQSGGGGAGVASTPQALQELSLFRQGGTNSTRGRQQRSTRSSAAASTATSNRSSSRSSVESASETLLNFAQQVGEVVSSTAQSS